MNKKHPPERIVKKLQEADGLRAGCMTVPDACKQLEIAVATYHQWRKKYRGMDIGQARQFNELEKENRRRKEMVAGATASAHV